MLQLWGRKESDMTEQLNWTVDSREMGGFMEVSLTGISI